MLRYGARVWARILVVTSCNIDVLRPTCSNTGGAILLSTLAPRVLHYSASLGMSPIFCETNIIIDSTGGVVVGDLPQCPL
jgi:hypothetical protein